MRVTSTHEALVVSAAGQLVIERVPTRRPRAGEMLVSPLRVGICGSDLDVLRGSRPRGTRILGHEGVAEVVAVGAGITRFSIGELVTFLPNNPNDPADVLGVSTEGLFQRYLTISQAALARGMLRPLVAGVPLVCGPLLEPLATVIYGQRLLEQVRAPASMLIVGAGPIGLLNVLYARGQGCGRIFLVDTSPARLEWAVERGIVTGAEALLNSAHVVETVLAQTGGQGVDAAYLCTPRSATRFVLTQALRVVREEGAISLTAATDSPEELPELPGVDVNGIRQANTCGQGHVVRACVTKEGKRLWMTGHSGASASYLQEAMRLVRREPATYAKVISHLISSHAAPRMVEQLLAGSPQPMGGAPRTKVIIDMTKAGEEIEAFDPQQWLSGDA